MVIAGTAEARVEFERAARLLPDDIWSVLLSSMALLTIYGYLLDDIWSVLLSSMALLTIYGCLLSTSGQYYLV